MKIRVDSTQVSPYQLSPPWKTGNKTSHALISPCARPTSFVQSFHVPQCQSSEYSCHSIGPFISIPHIRPFNVCLTVDPNFTPNISPEYYRSLSRSEFLGPHKADTPKS